MSVADYYDKQADNWLKRLEYIKFVRQKELASVLRNLNPTKDDKILDVGSGGGFYAKFIADNFGSEILCVDISPKMVDKLKSMGLNAIVGDVESLNLGNRTFDKVLLLGVLEFCKRPSLALRNIKQYISKNGFMLVLVPLYSILGLACFFYHYFRGMKINLFSKKKIKKLLHENNLQIESITKASSIGCLVCVRRID